MTTNDTARFSRDRVKTLSKSCGVYLMKDDQGEVIYIGKAKNLRARVRSYFSRSDTRANVEHLMKKVAAIDTLLTETERQALILESDLIKKYKPRYNIRLKDDKAHLLVRINMNHEWPKLDLVRKVEDDGARYIGPFAFSHELRSILDVIRRSLPLRTCSDRMIYNRVRPCLEYQIKRCAGPCCMQVDPDEYRGWIEQAIRMLEGKDREVVSDLKKQMEIASEQQNYELAAEIRDRVDVLKTISKDKPAIDMHEGSRDAFGLYIEGSQAEVSVLTVRQGRLYESHTFGFADVEIPQDELMASFLSQYYMRGGDVPEEVLLPIDLEDTLAREEMLSERRGAAVKLIVPKRGAKKRLLDLAESNAKENFNGRFGAENKNTDVLKELREELSLEELPRTIECVDVSHFQGGSTVGAVVMFKDGRPDKTRYRSFHLTQEGKPDDFASMREILTRHLSRSAEENTLSDLMVVDGGAGQLSQAVKVKEELGLLKPELIGLAKKRNMQLPYRLYISAHMEFKPRKPERVYLPGEKMPVVLKPTSEALHLLERIRDEAHRFAIGFHRKTRKRKVFKSDLDDIPGVGPKRRRDLLREFKNLETIRNTPPEEISERCGIPLSLATRVVETLRKKKREK